MQIFKHFLEPILSLIFPQICLACQNERSIKDQLLCISCSLDLVETDHVFCRNNDFEKHFLGRVKIEKGAAMYFFQKKTSIQNLMHEFKYNGNKEIGFELGNFFGNKYKDSEFLKEVDGLIPVPIDRKRKRQRGYNQSMLICQGLAKATNIPIFDKVLVKNISTISQTHKSREERMKNVLSSYKVMNVQQVNGMHCLLVDDILTTGATLEACVKMLEKHTDKLSIFTLAMGKYKK